MSDLFQRPPTVDPAYPQKQSEIEMIEGIPFKSPRHEEANDHNNPDGKDLRVETARWIKSHPEVAKLFLKHAKESAEAGQAFGMKALAEQVRWQTKIKHGKGYKISNNHIAYIARWIIAEDPTIEEFLRFRNVKY